MTYERDGRIARITLDRPERGNGITLEMPRELAACVERANLDPEVHVIALAGNGSGFCGGYDLVACAEGTRSKARPSRLRVRARRVGRGLARSTRRRSPPTTIPAGTWDPVVDYQMMSRNVRGFMCLFHSEKPVICKVHGYCVAGGTDMALCSDLLVVEDDAKIGYPPARVWGVPTTALWAHRLGAGPRQAPAADRRLDLTAPRRSSGGWRPRRRPRPSSTRVFEALLERVARLPVNQLVMHKLLVNQALLAPGPAGDPGARHRSSTGSPATRRRASRSSSAPPRPGSSRRCASATSRSATSGWAIGLRYSPCA